MEFDCKSLDEYLRILEQLLSFRIVIGFDLVVVNKVFLLACMWINLETVAVQSVAGNWLAVWSSVPTSEGGTLLFFSGYIMYNDILRYVWPWMQSVRLLFIPKK